MKSASSVRIAALVSIGIAAFLFCGWAISLNFRQSLFNYDSFRQTWAAISAYRIMNGGSILSYETPIFGSPWSMPLEFPLYQCLVAWLAKGLSIPLEVAGRTVAVLFYVLTFGVAADVLRSLKLSGKQAAVTLMLFAASPFYIFHARMFSLESTALFLAVAYLALALRLVGRNWILFAGVAIFGVLAGVVKVTTFAPFLLVALIAIVARYRRDRIGLSLAIGCAVLIPVAATVAWTHYADLIKSRNPLTAEMTSIALIPWNFGTLEQRLTLHNYFRFRRVVDAIVGSFVIVLLTMLLGFGLCRRALTWSLACCSLYLLAIELFFNLHFSHNYYAYANGIFLIAAVGIVLARIIEMPDWRGWVGIAVLALAVAGCIHAYFKSPFWWGKSIYEVQTESPPGRPALADFLRQSTEKDDVLVIVGLRWSAELPYQAQRRAIMDTWWPEVSPLFAIAHDPSLFYKAIERESKTRIAAVVGCDAARNSDRLRLALALLSMPTQGRFSADGCDVYLRRAQAEVPRMTP